MKKYLLSSFLCLFLSFQSKSITLNLNQKFDDSCNEGTGFIEVSVTGGVSPYSFVWSNGFTSSFGSTSNNSNLSAGTYSVTVYDAVGDTATASFSIINYPNLDHNGTIVYIFSAVDPSNQLIGYHPCPGQNNGMMFGHLEFTGGVSPYTAPGITSIFNPVTGVTNTSAFAGINIIPPIGEMIQVINLAAYDMFTIETSDAGGCHGTFYGQMMGPDDYSTNIISTLPSCNGLNNGSAIITYNGSNPWPLDVVIFDSTLTIPITTASGFQSPYFLVSSSLLPGVYYMKIAYSDLTILCDTLIFFSVSDAGTTCGTITGKVYLDSISNCSIDVNEPGLPSRIIKATPGPYYTFTDANGDFIFNLPYGTYNVIQDIPTYNGYNPNYFAVCNPAPVTISGINTAATANIGDSANTDFDLSIGITSGPARPGFNMYYSIRVYNNAFLPSPSPLVTVSFDPSLVLVSCNLPYTDLGGGNYSVQLSAINGFSTAWIQFVFTVPSITPIGSTLTANVSVADIIAETNTGNNFDSRTQFVQGSFDPNDKRVEPSYDPNNTFFIDIDSVLTYTVRFQNTGNDTAFNIRITDSLSSWLDISTLEIKASSHPSTWSLSGNGILEFRFDNILLPDRNTNEEASHGSVTYSIRPVSTVPLLTVIPNSAAIYFDFNSPVSTNTVTSLIDITVGLSQQKEHSKVAIVPNPANSIIRILLPDELQNDNYTFAIFNLQGQEIMRVNNVTQETKISLEDIAGGCYFYRLEKDGRMIENTQGKIILN